MAPGRRGKRHGWHKIRMVEHTMTVNLWEQRGGLSESKRPYTLLERERFDDMREALEERLLGGAV